MNIVEIHLVLNHIPIIGVAFVSAELLIGFICKNSFLQKVSMYFLILFAFISVAVYLSGAASEDLVKTLPGVSDVYLQLHEKVARISSVTVWFVGGFTLLGLIFLRGREQLFKYFARGVFSMTLISTVLFILTGYLGGQITHAEIRSTLAEGLSTRAVSIGVVVAMVLVLIAMLVPVFLNRDKIFKKVAANAFEENLYRQGQEQLSKQEIMAQRGISVSDHASSGSVPRKAATAMLYERDDQVLKTQSANHLPGLSALPDPGVQYDFPSWSEYGLFSSSRGSPGGQEALPLPEWETRPLPTPPSSPQRQKRGRRRLLIVLSIVGLVVILAGGAGFYVIRKLNKQSPLQLQTIANVEVSSQPGRFDYESLDQKTGLLFIAYSGADSVLVFDTRSNKVVATIPGVKDGHGVVTVPDLGRVYVSSGGTNEVVAIDELTHRIVARIPTGAGPDGSAYDPADHKLFVSDETGHSDTVIDVLTEKQIGTIPLGGEAGNTQYDPVSNRIYVNVQTLTQLVAIDPKSDLIVGRYPLPSANCSHNHGLNIDAAREIAFIACDDSNTLLMVDLHSMKVLDTATVGNGPDVLALDSGRNMLYVGSESGIVSIFEIRTSTVHKLAEGYIGIHAHTVAVNLQTHDIYLPLQNVNGRTIIEVAFFQT